MYGSMDQHTYPYEYPRTPSPLIQTKVNGDYNIDYSFPGSLLQELYDNQEPVQDLYIDQQHQQQQHQQHQQQQHHRDYSLIRRATFPYVRRDVDDQSTLQFPHPPFIHFQDPIPISAHPSALHADPQFAAYPDFDHLDDSHPIKLEDSQPVIVPSQNNFFRQPPSPSCHPLNMSAYLSPHTGLPVQHTDDAHSKETQYLRRRCFNCHTTEPPSWRRSTLNPGKIVCNKCGLYERTHLRPRPLRFDELRAGNKARKQSKAIVSPKSKMALVKKESREFGLVRRSSVSSSTSSSARSGSGTSDWDDNVSVYSSSGSAPPTSYNSPNMPSFPIPRESSSQSPPLANRDGGIRLPNAPLSDIASLQLPQQQPLAPLTAPPLKTVTSPAPAPYFPPREFFRRASMPEPETNGWKSSNPSEPMSVVPEDMGGNSGMVAVVS